jgi:hypothetical protein
MAEEITIIGIARKNVALLDDTDDMKIEIVWENGEREYMSSMTFEACYDKG